MYYQALAKGAGFSHQYAAPLAQGAIDGFPDARAAVAFGTAAVLGAGQGPDVGLPQVGEVPAATAVALGQRLPQPPGRRPVTQATTRWLARSTANHSHPLRFLRPTKGHISSSSRASHRFRWAFFGRRRDKGGAGAAAFFYPLGHPHPGHARCPHDAALRVAFHQQLVCLRVLHGLGHRSRHKPRLVPTRLALVLGVTSCAAIAPNMFAAARGT